MSAELLGAVRSVRVRAAMAATNAPDIGPEPAMPEPQDMPASVEKRLKEKGIDTMQPKRFKDWKVEAGKKQNGGQ